MAHTGLASVVVCGVYSAGCRYNSAGIIGYCSPYTPALHIERPLLSYGKCVSCEFEEPEWLITYTCELRGALEVSAINISNTSVASTINCRLCARARIVQHESSYLSSSIVQRFTLRFIGSAAYHYVPIYKRRLDLNKLCKQALAFRDRAVYIANSDDCIYMRI